MPITKYLYRSFGLPGTISLVLKNIHVQQKYLAEHIQPILKNTLGEAVSASRNAETQMQNQVQGRADLVDVVTAISSAESSLETVIAVRDQVISAYQEIMRMPI